MVGGMDYKGNENYVMGLIWEFVVGNVWID